MYTIIPSEQNPTLRMAAQDIAPSEIASPHIQDLIAQMSALLTQEKFGVALAAPQVGVAVRLFIVSGAALARDAAAERGDDAPQPAMPPAPDQIYINPEITRMSRGRKKKHEGCLSIRGMWGEVPRAEKASVRALDEHGKPFTRNASGFLAHIFQHEMDHLDGILYTDKAIELYEDEGRDETRK